MAKRRSRRSLKGNNSRRRSLRGRGRPRGRSLRGRSRGGARRLGSVIRIRKSGIGQLNKPSSVMGSIGPALIGGFATAGITIALRMMKPKTEMQMRIMENAPYVGGIGGTIIAMLLGMMSGKPAAWGAAAGSGVVSLSMIASEAVAKQQLAPMMAQNANGNVAGLLAGGRRMGAIVPEYANTRGLGAIVMEPQASRGYGAGPLGGRRNGLSAYGDTVNLGNVNQGAFGTPGFNVRGGR